ncbi:uncharacterized protein LOC108622876 isoform X2 [Ceratina calcarata]|uniref:Uncharacterized protein LOC108622876 isoform X2 n=1 Tax=Ceratina calcarata TaxID=156304 RepID=A0AAJ7RXL8_9HYME|nr:uncharacterized protein LOC108622876 isoform X2 [Ceratina calcarata]
MQESLDLIVRGQQGRKQRFRFHVGSERTTGARLDPRWVPSQTPATFQQACVTFLVTQREKRRTKRQTRVRDVKTSDKLSCESHRARARRHYTMENCRGHRKLARVSPKPEVTVGPRGYLKISRGTSRSLGTDSLTHARSSLPFIRVTLISIFTNAPIRFRVRVQPTRAYPPMLRHQRMVTFIIHETYLYGKTG